MIALALLLAKTNLLICAQKAEMWVVNVVTDVAEAVELSMLSVVVVFSTLMACDYSDGGHSAEIVIQGPDHSFDVLKNRGSWYTAAPDMRYAYSACRWGIDTWEILDPGLEVFHAPYHDPCHYPTTRTAASREHCHVD